MFSIGDTVFYEAHGVCTIVDIQEQTFSGTARDYYILAPIQNESLKLYHPVTQEKGTSKLTPVATKELAQQILSTFKNAPDPWSDRPSERNQHYRSVLKTQDDFQIAQVANTILRKENELKLENKKLHHQDAEILQRIMPNICNELAVGLSLSSEEIKKKIEQMVSVS
ncbi:CarD family transcriptional regulator [Aciduricibacillus chroicocephali]|uniref:CarD family transcriptional regulator n=1 Tax=Aciduricibacillus chroicocephali TaxID=3054939 RepID=A0ABY9KWM7_9BACI|nr:CarD family transcriptional regulator [Bacillaceae bacterium 44XB]